MVFRSFKHWLRMNNRASPFSAVRHSAKNKAGPSNCLAFRYAHCTDFDHCPYCSPVDQAVRFTSWAEKSWSYIYGDGTLRPPRS